MKNTQQIKAVFISLLFGISVAGLAQEEYCCERNMGFPDFEMPKGQERNISGFIRSRWLSLIIKTGAHELAECPYPIEIRSWEGSLDLDSMVEKMYAVTQKTRPKFQSNLESLKEFDYIWKGRLELLRTDRIDPGEWEDSYVDNNTKTGAKHYEPGSAWGRWRFTIQLYNPQWDEVVKEATTPEWDGAGDHYYLDVVDANREKGLPDGPFDDLYNTHFRNLKEIIEEYEKVPKKAQFESEVIKVSSDKTKRINFKVTDAKGEKPKKWQRLAVKVDFGTLTNGTPCCESDNNAKYYSFMCEDGDVTIEYKAPAEEESTLDHITVYNGCQTRDPAVVQMTNVDIREEIGSVEIDINPVYETRLIVKGRYLKNATSRYSIEDAAGVQRGREELNELQEATFYVPLALERSDEMPIFNQIWEYYRPKSISLSNCNVYSRKKTYGYASYNTGNGFEQTGLLIREPMGLQICEKDVAMRSYIIIITDKETGKVVKALPGGFAVDFIWHERYQLTGRSWSREGGHPINESNNRTDEYRSQYAPEPVEDPVPDPTIKSVSQSLKTYFKNLGTPLPVDVEIPEEDERPEISPDLLIEFGDGKTIFGADGKVVLQDEQRPDFRIYSEKTFYWQITRRKK